MPDNISYGIIILAAGNSSRLGQPKQLLIFRNISLLQNVILESRKVTGTAVAIVTGAWQTQVENDAAGQDVLIVHNAEWESGMASSIKTGVEGLCKMYPELDAVILTVCDQPFLTAANLTSLIREYIASDKGIVASSYNGTLGTPVLFSRHYFQVLMELQGQEGAKKIILSHPDDSSSVDFPEGETDIDTMEDYGILFS